MKRMTFAASFMAPFLAVTVAVAQQSVAPDTATKLAEYMNAQVQVNRFSGSVLLAREGKVLFANGYGMANLEHKIPNTTSTKFRLGSITKQFTAAVILQLQEKKQVSVEDSVCKYVDKCPEAWAPITIHHLLTHTSGIPNFTSFPDYQKTMMLASPPEKTLERFRDKSLEFTPGERFSYSNSGYVLLGVIIEKVTGQPYDRYLRENIFNPLGMHDTGYDSTATVIPVRASGYERRGEGNYANATFLDMTIPHAAGALYSTVEDFVKWEQALWTEKILTRTSLDAMFKPFRSTYAYGWNVQDRAGRKVISHGGGIDGFNTSFMRYPDDKLFAVVFSNVQGTAVGRVAQDLAAIALGLPYELPRERVEIKVDSKILDSYVGRYEFSPTLSITISREGEGLVVQLTGQSKLQMFPESETKFFLRAVDAQISFVKDADGRVTDLILHQGGRDQKAKRLE